MLGDDIAEHLTELRAEAESRMLDEYDINVEGDVYVFNPDSGKDERELVFLFHTIGRVKTRDGLSVRTDEVGERTSATVTREFHIPVDKPVVPVGAVAVPTLLHPTSDPTLSTAVLRLAGPAPGSQTTARRMQIEEVLS